MEETGKKNGKKKTDENSGHYVIASSRPPERRPLEHRILVPIADVFGQSKLGNMMGKWGYMRTWIVTRNRQCMSMRITGQVTNFLAN